MSFLISFLVGRGLSEAVAPIVAKLIAWVAVILVVVFAWLAIRQHYINVGWYKYKAKIEAQDNRAIAAGKKVEEQTQVCSDANGFWDVITQGCKVDNDDAVAQEKK